MKAQWKPHADAELTRPHSVNNLNPARLPTEDWKFFPEVDVPRHVPAVLHGKWKALTDGGKQHLRLCGPRVGVQRIEIGAA